MAYKRGDPLLNRTPLFLAASGALMGIVIALGLPFARLAYSYKVKGRKNMRALGKKPVIIVGNHSLPLDCLIHGQALLPRLSYFTVIEATILAPVLGTLVRLLGGVPIPSDQRRLPDIDDAFRKALSGRGAVFFYAEGECFLLNQEIKPFKAGAFYYAIAMGVPILPIVSVLKRGRLRLCVEVNILPPLSPPPSLGNRHADLQAARGFAEQTRAAMQARIDESGGDKSLYRGPMPRIRGVNDRER